MDHFTTSGPCSEFKKILYLGIVYLRQLDLDCQTDNECAIFFRTDSTCQKNLLKNMNKYEY